MKKALAEAVYLVAVMAFIIVCILVNPNRNAVPGMAGAVGEESGKAPSEEMTQVPDKNPTLSPDVSDTMVRDTVPEVNFGEMPGEEPKAPETLLPSPPGNEDKPERMDEAIVIRNENYESYANETKAWWFRRNTGHQPSGSGEDFPIAPYAAYYLDKEATEDDKVMYLTFDCGYENGFTPAILDTLAEKNVKAMFFVTKDFIVKNPEYVKRMKAEGHLVGNHTVRHLSSPELTPEELEAELTEVAKTMFEKTGYQIDSFFRPPMGEYSERTLKVTQDMGYASIFWSIAYYDYDVNNQPGKEYVVEHFTEYHHNGSIILMHNISESNTQALGDVIDLLRNEGYRMGELTELTK